MQDSFQKNRDVFLERLEAAVSGSNNIIFSANSPHILKKNRWRYNPPLEETDRINQSLACSSSASILFF